MKEINATLRRNLEGKGCYTFLSGLEVDAEIIEQAVALIFEALKEGLPEETQISLILKLVLEKASEKIDALVVKL